MPPLKKALLDAFTKRDGIAALEYAVLAIGVLTGLGAAVAVYHQHLLSVFSTTMPGLV